jgi:hypothetical protein
MGDPPQKHVWLQARIGIAEAELGDGEAALRSFAAAIRLARLAEPQNSPSRLGKATGPIERIQEQLDALPASHPARLLYQEAWEKDLP